MGEDPKKVFLVGCPSLDLINKKILKLTTNLKEKYSSYGVGELKIDFDKPYVVVLQHPVTTEYNLINKNINETIKAIMMIKHQIIWLWPNVDAGSDIVSKKIRIIREKKNQKISDGKKIIHLKII